MAKYLIESPHTNQGCLEALDEMLLNEPKILTKFSWGCNLGHHTGWALIDAKNESTVRKLLPTSLRSQARIFKVDAFTPKDIRQKHQR
ncbi:hypothetical protein HYS97_03115 [Candidatus Daviesbacteria bacterium]|nr:hypothetical protein [Candidatus Daviesbacteria bacterium]